MQVQIVNTYNNHPLSQRARGKNVSFNAIFYPKNVALNKLQKPIAGAITKALREPLYKFKGKTAEEFYESKGYDFSIEPYFYNSVSLTAYKGIKEIETGIDRGYTYFDRMYIGVYDKNSEFRISDVTANIKNKTWADNMLKGLIISGICGILATVGLNIKQSINTEPLIEKVDSVANKTKSILPDSTAINTKILKVIKK